MGDIKIEGDVHNPLCHSFSLGNCFPKDQRPKAWMTVARSRSAVAKEIFCMEMAGEWGKKKKKGKKEKMTESLP